MLPRSLALAPVLVAAALLPSTAAAAVDHDYTARIVVTTQHKNVQSEQTPAKSRSASTSLSTTFVVEAGLTFRDGQLLYPQGRVPVSESSTGKAESIYKDDWRHGTSACTANPASNPSGMAAIEQDLLGPLTGGERLNVRVTDTLSVDWDCTQISQYATFGDGGFHVTGEIGSGAMDATFDLPKEAIGQGKIIQLISGPPAEAGDFCPDLHESSTHCSFSWTGQMTLTKTATRRVTGVGGTAPDDDGDDLIAPLVPPKPAPVPPRPTDDGDDLIAPLVPAKVTLDARGKTVAFRAGCATGCSGTAVLTTPGARAAARRPLATLRFRVAAGAPRTVRLTLPRKARTALRRARRGTLAVTLRPKRGAAVRTRLALKVKR